MAVSWWPESRMRRQADHGRGVVYLHKRNRPTGGVGRDGRAGGNWAHLGDGGGALVSWLLVSKCSRELDDTRESVLPSVDRLRGGGDRARRRQGFAQGRLQTGTSGVARKASSCSTMRPGQFGAGGGQGKARVAKAEARRPGPGTCCRAEAVRPLGWRHTTG